MKLFNLIMACTLTVCTANAQQMESASMDNPVKKLISVSTNVSAELKSNVIKNFFASDTRDFTLAENLEYDLNNMLLGTFENSAVQVLYVNGINNNIGKTIAIFVKENLVSDLAMKIESVTDNNGLATTLIKDHEGAVFITVKENVDNTVSMSLNPSWTTADLGYISDNKETFNRGGPSLNNLAYKGWWDRWTGCVSTAFQQFTNGHSTAATIGGLVCVATGPYCAAGAALGCAGHATVFH